MNRYILFFVLLVMLAGCRSSKQTVRESLPQDGTELTGEPNRNKARKAEINRIRKVAENRLDCQGLSASARVKLVVDEKELGVNGKLFMKRDVVIRISMRFIGMELGILEFTPKSVLVVDRIHKQYVRVGYDEVKFLHEAELDFNAVQALFWNELFIPGKKDVAGYPERFTYEARDGRDVLKLTGTPKLDYLFYTRGGSNRIEGLCVQKNEGDTNTRLTCKYSQFEKAGNRSYPLMMEMQTNYGGRPIGLYLDLSGLNTKADGPVETPISSRYVQRSVDEVLKGLKR